jgi:pyruvate/2-oxoglutarate dehydrogenase complex dihydrolipoamide acyltransferase (E2) component
MVEVLLKGLGKEVEEGTIQSWFFEEGDAVSAGDDLVELTTEEGSVIIQSPVSGLVAEVYYDEGEAVAKDEILCMIDDEAADEDEEADEK